MAAPVFAPYVPAYATYTPYLTAAEYLAEPTGVDVGQLIPGKTIATNTAALIRVIARASSFADNICQQILAATSDIQAGVYRVQRDGTIIVPVNYTPIIELTDVAVGYSPTTLTSLPDLSGCWLQNKVAIVPIGGVSGTAFTPPGSPSVAAGPGRVFARLTYVNGYAHTLSSAVATAGTSQVQVVNPLGIFPGLPFTIYDSGSTEQNTVAATYTTGSTTVPTVTPLLNTHAAGVSVSALPGFAREAVISLTSALIKTRGSEAVAMPMMAGQADHIQALAPGAGEDLDLAIELLQPLRRVR